ncbi:DsrE family protein [Flammeovirga kamogawensis]|uniref:DsrE family protein n=1 Tax=Flammeovirga kamogawensis TaxID=373891 RepID=A0ABX8GS87_9BACT|nr:hypothetical protein [Flammeovirga kamogawensis]MBB6461356.1 intracellular sulfur oxidation DsrE/DsrF family protein [Flammeovirga kamogawensis]QWG06261.1 hypothetical protein KM029_13055 [Flammeovirga kamogawensis]TRX68091.1 hypothetical protein EO216_08075 [Flammeovirga kamogawensis]
MERHIVGVVLASIFITMTLAFEKYGEDSFVFHVESKEHLEEVLSTTDSLETNEKIKFHKAEVIVCGDALSSIMDDVDTMKRIASIDPDRIQLSICQSSIDKHNINIEEFPQQVNIISNGLVRFLELQESGYKGIDMQ